MLLGLIVGAAFAAMKLISLPPTNVTAIWLPAGVALVGLLRPIGWSALPTILLANWAVVALANDYALLSFRPYSLLICAANTAGPALSCLVWKRWLKGNPFLDGVEFLKFTFGVAFLPAVLTAWAVIATIYVAGYLPGLTLPQFWIRTGSITISSALGVFLVMPLVYGPWESGLVRRGAPRWLAHLGVVAAAMAVCWLSDQVLEPLIYLAIPLALVAAIISGARGVVVTILVVSIYGLSAITAGGGPFTVADPTRFSPVFAMGIFAFSLGLPGQFAGITFAQLYRHRRDLEELVIERTRDLATAKEAAESADRAKSEFLAVMSHEIRTPLNGVLGFARLMETSKLDEQQREFMHSILSSGEMLLGLLNNILDLSKIEANAIELEAVPFSLRGMVDDVARLCGGAAAGKGIVFEATVAANVPDDFVGDVTRVRQVLINLVSNAVKFTAKGTISVAVTAEPDNPSGGAATATAIVRCWRLSLAVTDSGIGISPEQQQRLFAAFSQADTSITRRYGGSGLGLAISRRLCGLMGGTLEVVSAVGKGSTFVATLRLAEVEQSSPAEEPVAPAAVVPVAVETKTKTVPPSGRALHVLVAEDNALNRRLVGVMLERLGHSVVFALNGREAIDRLEAERFDVVLMDIQMPEMDGIQATRRIRAAQALARDGGALPIIAVTADVTVDDRTKCLQAGMDDFLMKPIKPARFRAVLEQIADR